MSQELKGERSLFFTWVAILSLFVLLIFSHSFLPPIISGVVFACGLRPLLHKFPFSRIRSPLWRSRLLVLSVLILGIAVTTYVLFAGARGIVNSVEGQGVSKYEDHGPRSATKAAPLFRSRIVASDTVEPSDAEVGEVKEPNSPEGAVDRLKSLLQMIPGMDAADVTRTWTELLTKARDLSLRIISNIVTNAPALLVQWVVFILTFVFVFLNYEGIFVWINEVDKKLFKGLKQCALIFEEATQVTLLGTLVAGFCQASIISLGSAIAGFNSFLLLGLCSFFASFIPFFGVGVVWGSTAIYALLTGNTQAAIIMVVTGGFSSVADNLIMPTFLSANTRVHPIVLFVVILGAIDLLGIWGLFVGPTFAIFSIQVMRLWMERRMGPLPKEV